MRCSKLQPIRVLAPFRGFWSLLKLMVALLSDRNRSHMTFITDSGPMPDVGG
jgi:hypothetical protein